MGGWNNLPERTKPRLPSNRVQARKTHVPGRGTVRLDLAGYCKRAGIVNQKGEANRAEVQRRTKVSDDALFYMLRYPETVKQIYFSTLARLCHGLNCTPGDLLVYDRTEDSATPLSEQYKADPTLGLE